MEKRAKCQCEYCRIKPDDDAMHEECGVFGIYAPDGKFDPAEVCYIGLFALQHRGQESAGIAVADEKYFGHLLITPHKSRVVLKNDASRPNVFVGEANDAITPSV